jgi:signal transduction histidine kinase
MPEDHARAHDDYIESYKRTGVGKIIGAGREVEGKRKNGSLFPLDLSVAEWRDAQDRRFFTGIMRDITERKQTAEVLARTRRLDALGQLVSGIAHDFNNLLTVIVGNLEFANARIEDEKTRDLIRAALETAERGASFNRRLLLFTREREFSRVRLVLNERITETTKLLKRTLGEDIALALDLAPDLWPTLADPGDIDTVILNLAVNARDAMPRGGELIIKTSNDTLAEGAPEIDPNALPGNYVRVSIADTGVGMSQDVMRRAMEPFFTIYDKGARQRYGARPEQRLWSCEAIRWLCHPRERGQQGYDRQSLSSACCRGACR